MFSAVSSVNKSLHVTCNVGVFTHQVVLKTIKTSVCDSFPSLHPSTSEIRLQSFLSPKSSALQFPPITAHWKRIVLKLMVFAVIYTATSSQHHIFATETVQLSIQSNFNVTACCDQLHADKLLPHSVLESLQTWAAFLKDLHFTKLHVSHSASNGYEVHLHASILSAAEK